MIDRLPREGLDRHVFEARRIEEEGVIAKVKRLHAEVARAEAEREARQARRDLEVAEAALSGLLSDTGEIAPTSPLFLCSEIAPVDSFLVLADRTNADFAYLGLQRDLTREALTAQRGSLLPEVAIGGGTSSPGTTGSPRRSRCGAWVVLFPGG